MLFVELHATSVDEFCKTFRFHYYIVGRCQPIRNLLSFLLRGSSDKFREHFLRENNSLEIYLHRLSICQFYRNRSANFLSQALYSSIHVIPVTCGIEHAISLLSILFRQRIDVFYIQLKYFSQYLFLTQKEANYRAHY